MENTYKRKVKYQYYKIVLFEKDGRGDWHKKSDFNFADWLAKLDDEGLLNKKVELRDCYAYIEKIDYNRTNEIYTVRIFKLRDVNIPSKVKDGEESQIIPLDEDEYIGEDITLLYDRNSGICMIQSNRMSVSVSKLQEWINKDMEEGYMAAFYPVYRKTTQAMLRGKQIRAIDITFANLEESNSVRSLGQIIKGIQKFNGLTGHITIGMGRKKGGELNPEQTLELVEELNQNREIISSAKVKMRDDDMSRVEIVDLFDDLLHEYIVFDIEKKQPLDFEQARAKMLMSYLSKKDGIIDLIRKR